MAPIQKILPGLEALLDDLLRRIGQTAPAADEALSTAAAGRQFSLPFDVPERVAPYAPLRFTEPPPALQAALERQARRRPLPRASTPGLRDPVVPGRPPDAPLPAFPDYGPPIGPGPDEIVEPAARIPLTGTLSDRIRALYQDPTPRSISSAYLPETIPGLTDEAHLIEAEDLLAKLRARIRNPFGSLEQRNQLIQGEDPWERLVDLVPTEGGGITHQDYRALVEELGQVAQNPKLGPGAALARLRAAASLVVPEERVSLFNQIGPIDEASPEYLAQLRQQHGERVRNVIAARREAVKALPGERGLSQYQENPIKQTSWGLADQPIERMEKLRPGVPENVFEATRQGKLGSIIVTGDQIPKQGLKPGEYVLAFDQETGEQFMARIKTVRRFSMSNERTDAPRPTKAHLIDMASRQGMTPDALEAWLKRISAGTIQGDRALYEIILDRPQTNRGLDTVTAVRQTLADRAQGPRMAPGEERRVPKRIIKTGRTKRDYQTTGAPVEPEKYLTKELPPERPLPAPGGRDVLQEVRTLDEQLLEQIRFQSGRPVAPRSVWDQSSRGTRLVPRRGVERPTAKEMIEETRRRPIVQAPKYESKRSQAFYRDYRPGMTPEQIEDLAKKHGVEIIGWEPEYMSRLKGAGRPYEEPASTRYRISLGERAVVEPETGRRTRVRTQTMVEVSEARSQSYLQRTRENVVRSDATIAIGLDPSSPGTAQTKKFAAAAKKPFAWVEARKSDIPKEADRLVKGLNEKVSAPKDKKKGARRGLVINIAGNGIETLVKAAAKRGARMDAKELQKRIDEYVYNLLKAVVEHKDRKFDIAMIRTGGQTGVDIAAARAAARLGIRVKVHMPKGGRIRGATKGDVHLLDDPKYRRLLPRYLKGD